MVRENLWVCEHCLIAIESREGKFVHEEHCVDEDDDDESRCDWCGEDGFDMLCELISRR